jgi:hypothetical protein
MPRDATVIALIALAVGAYHLLDYRARRHHRPGQPDPLQTWEAEGGAVPVGRHRIAAQTTPA